MLHSAKFLCSVAAAVARLLHALLMSLCSPRTPPAALQQVHAIVAKTKLARPAAMAVPEDEKPPPPVLVLPALFKKGEKEKGAKAARGRPSRLVIPPPPPVAAGCAAGFDPFGEAAAADRVAAEVMEEQGEGFCVASRRGVRHAMEDAYGVVADQICGESRMAFYGVYDGHGGRAAVDLVAERLGKNVVAAAATASRGDELGVMAAIRAGYLTTDNEFLSQGLRGGCCAATALLKDGDLYVANAGDCRAVLGTRSGAAVALTSDHTPARDDERRRIESRGGYVSKGSGGVWRVQGTLAVSRALGDADMRAWGVTGVPEVRAPRRVTPDCAFLVLASDGVWSKVSDQEAVDAVNRSSNLQYSESESEAESMDMQCCKALVALARSRGSRDDITAMVVDLQRFLILPR